MEVENVLKIFRGTNHKAIEKEVYTWLKIHRGYEIRKISLSVGLGTKKEIVLAVVFLQEYDPDYEPKTNYGDEGGWDD